MIAFILCRLFRGEPANFNFFKYVLFVLIPYHFFNTHINNKNNKICMKFSYEISIRYSVREVNCLLRGVKIMKNFYGRIYQEINVCI